MVECTFFLDECEENFEYHIHWKQLNPIIKNNSDVHFILIHFSMRYTWDEIGNFFEKQKNELPNITVWMN
jgi:ribonuclease BN (tRNA processing enzyme)